MFNLILFGPPGSGKGTQSQNIIDNYQLIHISTGDLLREEVAQQSPLGIEAKRYMDGGQLVPDSVVIGMIESKLKTHTNARGFIFDGFPRTTAQAEALDSLLHKNNTSIKVLIALEVPEEELKHRLLERGKISGRSDDNEEVIQKRIIEYKLKTEPVAAYYQAKGLLRRIKGDGTIEATFQLIKEELNTLMQVEAK